MIDFTDINRYIDSLLINQEFYISFISFNKMDNYKIIIVMVSFNSQIDYMNYVIYDNTDITFRIDNNKKLRVDEQIGKLVIDVCKKFNL